MGCACCKSNNDAVFYEKACSVCSLEGKNSEAFRYCYTCDALLCEKCVKKHRRNTKTKDHKIGEIPLTPEPTPVPPTPVPPTPPPPPRMQITPQPPPMPSEPRLIPAGEFTFKANGKQCCVTGYDVLPNGKIVISDGRNKHIHVFSQKYQLLCSLHVKFVLDVAALSNNKLVFVYGEKSVAFVLIGVRYRHMEIEKEAITEHRCLRVRHYQERIFVVCVDYAPYTSFVVLLNMNGVKLKKIESPDFSMNFITINPSSNEIFVTGIAGGIKVFDLEGNALATYRDVDIQWYYGIAADKYGNVFVCTQDEFGPEVYMLEQEKLGNGIKGLSLQLTAREGLKTPYRLCYNPKYDLLLVGSNDIGDKAYRMTDLNISLTKSDNSFPVPVENKDPDAKIQEARVKNALMEGSWGNSELSVYKIHYSYATHNLQIDNSIPLDSNYNYDF